ncbi:hypothetical protein [Lysinibacillus sp. FJAT-14745]|uniref:hypothetical protein n=1 Tax=Lysinibacillus sp. FJAT-14745 TaxID=1704289 RepID=UPI000A4EFF34|nr:hypothetical protein [Lysinibacillus sp. FJAT-14745]
MQAQSRFRTQLCQGIASKRANVDVMNANVYLSIFSNALCRESKTTATTGLPSKQ